MIQKGWFLEGQTDQKETCLITSTETYRQYTETQKALEQRNEEECRKRQQETEQQKQISPEVQEVLDKGEAYIQKIHASNDAIPGEEISAKIARMEQIVEQIFRGQRSIRKLSRTLKNDGLLSTYDSETSGCL